MKHSSGFKSSHKLELVCTTNFNSTIRSSLELHCSFFELSHFYSLILNSALKKLEPGEYPVDVKFNVSINELKRKEVY